ncbi:DUF2974 domain-containing protein [Olsenella sp. YH-ols2217]|uniref:DUF2974 domain-containing protein n=1 Tax=Kribbibacterium absianum TaxID=3044210 RepID=A0ABT6ZJY7_9ACTN|nr:MULTISPECIES: Mbeg1-like protein [unclassified Olsenella]MDJ1122381.1 DUF2974 domain-containing protein [Olsenella sp. YH-ols2216]MDJ1129365.1 DUF2974 domain-containing protein [Olsenella sp. YH-ols2217]
MANMLDYLDWFGDVPLDQVPFNEVDNAILAQLSYVAFEGVVPWATEDTWVTMAEAAEEFRKLHGKGTIYGHAGVISPLTSLLPQKLAEGRRFSGALVGRLHSRTDVAESEQLAVFQVRLSDGSTYVTFRGTDDTIVGWREDFEMTYGTVTSQRDAVTYLNVTCADIPAPIMVGGHSKGGNLAVYAAALCDQAVRDKISVVWNDDGPGFDEGVLPASALDRIRDRVRTYVPAFDVVGQLLDVLEPTKIVLSSDQGVMQHSAMGWQVRGTEFVGVEPQELLPSARKVNAAFDQWLGSANQEKRRELFGEFFDCLEAAGVRTLSDLLSGDPSVVTSVVSQMADADPAMRDYVIGLLMELASITLQDSAAQLAETAGAAVQDFVAPAPALDPETPLSAEEMARYRRTETRRRRFSSLARLLGLTTQGLQAVLAVAGGATLIGVLALWFSDRSED